MESGSRLRIALWDDPDLDEFAARLAEDGAIVAVDVVRQSRGDCLVGLSAGLCDAAMVPSVSVLSDSESYEVYPSAAYSSWKSAGTRIILRHGFTGATATVACDARFGQEAFMARIVLREHYSLEPAFVPLDSPSRDALMGQGADAVLISGAGDLDASGPHEGVVLDLGQEWFEHTNYPMVWGLFAARSGEADARIFRLLAAAADDMHCDDPSIEELVDDASPRFRLDDLATASLTELAEQLFYYHVTEDVADIRFARDPDAPPDDVAADEDDS